MSEKMDENKLTKYFEIFGDVKNVIFPKVFRGFCFVTFMNINAVYEVMDVGNCHEVCGEKLSVAVAREDLKKGGELGYIPTGEFYKSIRRSETPPTQGRRPPFLYYQPDAARTDRRRFSRSPLYHQDLRHRGSNGEYYDDRYPPRMNVHMNSRTHYGGTAGGGGTSHYKYSPSRSPKYSSRMHLPTVDHRAGGGYGKYSVRSASYLEHDRPAGYRPRT